MEECRRLVFDPLGTQRPIKPPIRLGTQMRVMPEQREVTVEAMADVAIALRQRQGLVVAAFWVSR